MKKRVLSLFMVLVLCLTLLPTAAFAEGEDVSISGGVIGGGETGGEGGGIYPFKDPPSLILWNTVIWFHNFSFLRKIYLYGITTF